jgi:hypothetical protein
MLLRLLLIPMLALSFLAAACDDEEKKPTVRRTVVSVPVTPSPCPTQRPVPSGSAPTFSVTPNQFKAGAEITVEGSGFTPHGIVIAIGVAPNGLCLPLGSGPVDEKGSFTATTTVQPIAPPGQYQLRLTDGAGRTASQPVTLLPP